MRKVWLMCSGSVVEFRKNKTKEVISLPTKPQKCWKKSGGMPSELGAFNGAIWERASCTSHSVNSAANFLFMSSVTTVSIVPKANSGWQEFDEEYSLLKKSVTSVAMTLWFVHHYPNEFLIPDILFLRYHYVAFMWKNFEFLSPWTAHKDRERWNHVFISLSNKSLTSLLSIQAWKLIPVLRATSSAWASSLCFFFTASFGHTQNVCYSIFSGPPHNRLS